MTPYNAIVLDDHKLFAESFANSLQQTFLFDKILIFNNVKDLIHNLVKIHDNKPYFLFLDYYLDEKPITENINLIKSINPKSIIVIVSCISNPMLINNILDYPIFGIISKSDGINEIINCINAVGKASFFHSNNIKDLLFNAKNIIDVKSFTNREIQILNYFAKGYTVDATASALNLSRHTIAAHRRKMFSKANVNKIAELLAFARTYDLIF